MSLSLSCCHQVASGDRVFVIAATSKRDDIDPALRRPGRLDGEVEIGVPSMRDRVDVSAAVFFFHLST